MKLNPKVAYFIDTFFDINGVARTSQALMRLCEEQGREFRFIVSDKDNDSRGLLVNFPPKISFRAPYYPELSINIPSFFSLLRYCREEKFDIIYAPTPGALGLYALIISKWLGLPLVSAFHTDFAAYMQKYTGSKFVGAATRFLLRQKYNRSVRALSPSETYKRLLVRDGVKEELITVFKRGADKTKFNPSFRDTQFWKSYIPGYAGEPVALYVGRVSDEKSVEVFAEVAKALKNERCRFVVVGDGPARAKLEESGENIVFVGYLVGEPLSIAYASSDIFVFPSKTETFGNVVIEAFSSGLVCVVSDEGACQEHIVEGENGFVVANNDVSAYAKIIIELLNDSQMLSKMRQNAIKSVEELDSKALLSKMLDIISLK